MAADFYDRMGDTATRLLTKYNQGTYTLVRVGAPVPGVNPWDAPTAGADTTYTVYGIAEPVELKYVDGETVVATDKQMMIARFATTPLVGDVLRSGTSPLTVVKVEPVSDRACAWLLFLRG